MKQKNILAIVIILTIICILVISIIFKLLNEEKNNIDISGDSPELYINTDLKELTGKPMLFTIENIIEKNIKNVGGFYAEKIYFKDIKFDEETRAYIYGTIWNTDFTTKENIYIIIDLQQRELLYNMEIKQKGITKVEFEEIIKALKDEAKDIKYDSNNKFGFIQASDEQMVRRYMDYYTTLALYSPKDAYELLDEEYKQKRFGSLESYLQYVNDKKDYLQELTLQKYGVDYQATYSDYIAVDTENNYYIIRQKGLFDIKIQLDNYTIEDSEYVIKYNTLSDDEKVKVCASKFIKMINAKDYENLYNLVDETFKANNFKNIENFKKYINNKYFKYNVLSKTEITKQANAYICKLTVSSGNSSSAEEMNTNIIIEITEGTSFKIAFVK